ncbi:hypothetical protein N836_01690 [Leptolyngbya sp. Heron Island J]|nr:hypothetical protein N836_01690 [Leptolyngbya sp. Heron Island J]
MNKAIASANALEQTTFGTVVEKTGIVPGSLASARENRTEDKMLN